MNNSSNGGVGFVGLLQLLFIGLKLADIIQWSWLWVFAPIWIPTLLIILICLLIIISKRK